MRNHFDKGCREKQNLHFKFNNFFSFENYAVYEIKCKNTVQPDQTPMTNGACALHARYLRLKLHTQNI